MLFILPEILKDYNLRRTQKSWMIIMNDEELAVEGHFHAEKSGGIIHERFGGTIAKSGRGKRLKSVVMKYRNGKPYISHVLF